MLAFLQSPRLTIEIHFLDVYVLNVFDVMRINPLFCKIIPSTLVSTLFTIGRKWWENTSCRCCSSQEMILFTHSVSRCLKKYEKYLGKPVFAKLLVQMYKFNAANFKVNWHWKAQKFSTSTNHRVHLYLESSQHFFCSETCFLYVRSANL